MLCVHVFREPGKQIVRSSKFVLGVRESRYKQYLDLLPRDIMLNPQGSA